MGKSTKQTTTQTNAPPAWAKPLFTQSASEAQKAYQSGQGGNVYQGPRVAEQSGQTQAGLQGINAAAGNWDMPGYGNMLEQASGPTAASSYLGDMASGKWLQEGNPFYKERLNSEIQDANALINSSFSGSGRYGSGANAGVVAKNTNNMLLQGLENDWNRNQANQLSAVGMIDNAANANMMTRLGIGNQAFQNQLAGAQAQTGAGQMQDAYQQSLLDANREKWTEQDMLPWNRLGLLQSAAAGSAGNYGTSTGVSKTPGNPLAAVGALGSLFTKSDARLKERFEAVGYEKGHVLWEFSYSGSPERFRGVMAQLVLESRPDAVVMEPDGFYAVDYAKIGLEMERV